MLTVQPGQLGDDADHTPYEPSAAGEPINRFASNMGTTIVDDDEDATGEYNDDASSHEGGAAPVSRDAFNITAQSAKLQLDLLAQVSAALHTEQAKNPDMKLSDAVAMQALNSYEAAVGNLKGLVGDLLKISRDRDAYWQYRLDREANIRRLWEESMAKVAQEQEELQARMGESEDKRKKTKRALRDALEGRSAAQESTPATPERRSTVFEEALQTQKTPEKQESLPAATVVSVSSPTRRKTVADLDLSDSESDEDEEFFDAVGAGEVEVVEYLPATSPTLAPHPKGGEPIDREKEKDLEAKIEPSFKGYEEPVRKRLKLDADNRPRISLWVS